MGRIEPVLNWIYKNKIPDLGLAIVERPVWSPYFISCKLKTKLFPCKYGATAGEYLKVNLMGTGELKSILARKQGKVRRQDDWKSILIIILSSEWWVSLRHYINSFHHHQTKSAFLNSAKIKTQNLPTIHFLVWWFFTTHFKIILERTKHIILSIIIVLQLFYFKQSFF